MEPDGCATTPDLGVSIHSATPARGMVNMLDMTSFFCSNMRAAEKDAARWESETAQRAAPYDRGRFRAFMLHSTHSQLADLFHRAFSIARSRSASSAKHGRVQDGLAATVTCTAASVGVVGRARRGGSLLSCTWLLLRVCHTLMRRHGSGKHRSERTRTCNHRYGAEFTLSL